MRVKVTKKVGIDSNVLVIGLIIIAVLAYVILSGRGSNADIPDKSIVQCIASKSTIYISPGCHACASQKEMFGENFEYLNYVDCLVEGEKCSEENITRVPTWLINGQRLEGVQPIEKLINLTGCNI